MDVTRRQFLGCAAGAMATMALRRGLALPGASTSPANASATCALLDLGAGCAIRESLLGYESALASSGTTWTRVDAEELSRCTVLIVPAALEIPASVAHLISSCVRSGATVILESGAGFCDEGDRQFVAHRDALREHLRIRIGAPVPLWPRHHSLGLPYVDYTWPTPVKVRDFSRVVPLAPDEDDGEIIARVDGLPVALRRRAGRGTLLFLGSPLGPAVRAGDGEGRRWVLEVLLTATEGGAIE